MKKMTCITLNAICLSLLLIGMPRPALTAFPEKNIVWIVPFRPGGGFDTYSRTLSRVMPKYLPKKVNIIIKNMAGAGGTVGTSYLYRSKPDGHTMGILNFPGMAVLQRFKKTAYDTNKFVYLGAVGGSVYILALPVKSRFRTLEDLQKAEKPVRFGSEGKGTTGDFMLRVGTKGLNIPTQIVTGYKGAPTIIVAALRGDVDASLYGSLEVNLRFIRSGEMSPLFIFDTKRSEHLPDTPTVIEMGYGKQLTEIRLLRLVALPPGTPKKVAEILKNALKRALEDEATKKWAKEQKVPIKWSPEESVREKIAGFSKIAEKYRDVFK